MTRRRRGYGCGTCFAAILLLAAVGGWILATDGGPPEIVALRVALSDAVSGALHLITEALRAVPSAPESDAG